MAARLERITANLRRGYDADSKERAKELEDSEVVDALGNEAREELAKISAALRRMDLQKVSTVRRIMRGVRLRRDRKAYGRLWERLHPYADECIEPARSLTNTAGRTANYAGGHMHFHKIGERSCLHFLHDSRAMNFNGALTYAKLVGDYLVRLTL